MNFEEKYLKYKKKYLDLKTQIGSASLNQVSENQDKGSEIIFTDDVEEWEVDNEINEAINNKFSEFPEMEDGLGSLNKIYYEETDIGPVPKKNEDMTPEERERSFNKMIESIFNSLLC